MASLVNQHFGHHAAHSSYTLPRTLACYRLGQSGDSDVVAEDHFMFYNSYFAAMWNSLDVPAPVDCISAVKPKVVLRPVFLFGISFLVEANGWRATTLLRYFRLMAFLYAVLAAFFVLKGARQVERDFLHVFLSSLLHALSIL